MMDDGLNENLQGAHEAVMKSAAESKDQCKIGSLHHAWAVYHNLTLTAFRVALGMPNATAEEMVERIGSIKAGTEGDRPCGSSLASGGT